MIARPDCLCRSGVVFGPPNICPLWTLVKLRSVTGAKLGHAVTLFDMGSPKLPQRVHPHWVVATSFFCHGLFVIARVVLCFSCLRHLSDVATDTSTDGRGAVWR